jgi:ABC-2 type transport system permease protein
MPVFDQGYQHWSGALSGHAWRWLTITRHGVRIGMKNIFLRLVVIASWFPAVFMAFILCLWGLVEQNSALVQPFMWVLAGLFPAEVLQDPKNYRVEVWTLCYHFFLQTELYLSMVVVLLVGPNLISQDLRFNALQLYFARPLRRIDYFVGKLGVIGWFLSMVIILPSLIAYVLGLLFSLDITIVRDTYPLLLACLGFGAVVVLSAGTLMLALSSLSRNSRYIALFWVGLWFVTMVVGSILNGANDEQRDIEGRRKRAAADAAAQQHGRVMTPEERIAQQRAREEALQKAEEEIRQDDLRADQTNWRWLPSYSAHLSRIGQVLLNTDAAKAKVGKLYGPHTHLVFLAQGPQYPWYWSAAVLAVLFGLSACILNYRVRSLDRLK